MKHVCPECTGTVNMNKYEHLSRVGGVKVIDGSCVQLTCTACGNVDLTADEFAGYERRAAALVLRSAPKATGAMARYARKALGLSQSELGQLLECTPETVSRWENGHQPLQRDSQLALVAALEVVERHGIDAKRLTENLSSPMPTELRLDGEDCVAVA